MFQSYLLWFLGAFFYAYQLVLRTLPVITEDSLREIFNLSDKAFGQVRGIYYIGYAVAHLPMAYILDKYGLKRTLPVFILMAVVGVFPMIWGHSTALLIIGRIVLGIGSSAAILSVFKIIRLRFDNDHFSRMLGIAATLGCLCMVLGQGPLKTFFMMCGFETSLMILCGMGVLLSLLTFLLFPKNEHTGVSGTFWEEVKALFLNKNFLYVTTAGGLMIGAFEGFADGWSAPYLVSMYRLDLESATYGASMIYFGFALGGPVLSAICDVLHNHQKATGYSGLVMAALFLPLFFLKLPCSIVFLIYFIIGFFCAYQVMLIYLAGRAVDKSLVNLSGAGANMIIMGYGYLFHTLTAYLMEGAQTVQQGCCYYSLSNFHKGLYIIPTLATVGGLMFIFYKNNKH